MGSSFCDEAVRCDLAFCGPPCNNISWLNNHFRDSIASDARLFADTVDMIAINNHKLGIIETPLAVFDDDNHRLLQDMYSKYEHHDYGCIPLNMNPTDYGGVQHRPRYFFLVIRSDVYAANSSFPQIPKTPGTRTLCDILEPAGRLNLRDLLIDI